MECVVLKFGGTSVSTPKSREIVVEKIKVAKETYKNIAVVVSAMGRLGSPYATDTLLSLLEPDLSSDRERDLLVACGEIISAVNLSNLLKQAGLKSEAVTGGQSGIITDDSYTEAEAIELKPEKLIKLIEDDIIPVVAGFQGITIDGEITTLGRGGSDTTAALLGQALKAKQVEIFTDVDGIMTADPRLCKTAKTIKELSYSEVFQLADSGAKVIHPRAVEIARRNGFPLIIKNTFSETDGTSINSLTHYEVRHDERIITGIAHRVNRIQINIISSELDDEQFFGDLAKENVSIDIINIFPDRKVFTTDAKCKDRVVNLLNRYKLKYNCIDDCSKVTVIGERMTGVPGVMARVIRALSSKNIKILQTADSLATIACLIKTSDVEAAIETLHKEFKLD